MNHIDCIAPRPGCVPRRRPRIIPAACQRFWVWYERARQRRQLLLLDKHLRRDIGLTAEEALREARKPFWRA